MIVLFVGSSSRMVSLVPPPPCDARVLIRSRGAVYVTQLISFAIYSNVKTVQLNPQSDNMYWSSDTMASSLLPQSQGFLPYYLIYVSPIFLCRTVLS